MSRAGAFQSWSAVAAVFIVLMMLSTVPYGGASGTETLPDDAGVRAFVGSGEKEFTVEKGGIYVAGINTSTDRVDTMGREYGISVLLSDDAMSAVNATPQWMHRQLEERFVTLSMDTLNCGKNSAPTLSDMDGDGLSDIAVGMGNGTLAIFLNRGNPFRAMYVPVAFHRIGGDFLRPAIGDVDGDGSPEVALGTPQGVEIYHIDGRWNLTPVENLSYPYGSPALADMDGDGLCEMVVGTPDGKAVYLDNSNGTFSEVPLATTVVRTSGYTAPALADMDSDGDYDLLAAGDNGIMHYYPNIGTANRPVFAADNPAYLVGISAGSNATIASCDVNGDTLPDIYCGDVSGYVTAWRNFGDPSSPSWEVWSTYDAFPGYEYYPPEEHLRWLNYSWQDIYAGVIFMAEQEWRDEVAYSIIRTPVEDLKAPWADPYLYVDNARYIYENDKYIHYADVIDVDWPGYEGGASTIRYSYIAGGTLKTAILEPLIYYDYIVSPKITDEDPAYIDPATGEVAPRDEGGRFWREYLFWHNDTSYPPDPDPTDNLDMYPNDTAPPLLKDLLEGVDVLWNSTTWHAPADRDPYYGSNAVIRVSNWVGKTLILNQQEVSDDERPIQPVRIAAGHNGNCGELQDLTVAAARSALIPAAGVLLLAEDHVWCEFYDRGWHQWDNYWSDAGSIIADEGNYWYGWGERGGSGVMRWHPDDSIEDVTTRYVPGNNISVITIRVEDRTGRPVDGARVVALSYWIAPDVQGYQTPVPYPGMWNFTNGSGMCEFRLAPQENVSNANRNFSFRIISRVGSAFSGKLQIQRGKYYNLTYTLEGAIPGRGLTQAMKANSSGLFVSVSMGLRGWQLPPNMLTGNIHNFASERECQVALVDSENLALLLAREPFEAFYLTPAGNSTEFTVRVPGSGDVYLVIWNLPSVETYLGVKVAVSVSRHNLTIESPGAGETFYTGDVVSVAGHASELPTVRAGGKELALHYDTATGEWQAMWDTTGLSPGWYAIEAATNFLSASVSVHLEYRPDTTPPEIEITSPSDGFLWEAGSQLSVSGRVVDDRALATAALLLSDSHGNVVENDITDNLSGGVFNVIFGSENLSPGPVSINLEAEDMSGNSATTSVNGTLSVVGDIVLDVSSPAFAELGSLVTIKGEAYVDSGGNRYDVDSLKATVNGVPHDVYLSGGSFTMYLLYTVDYTSTGPIWVSITAAAGDEERTVDTTVIIGDTTPPDMVVGVKHEGNDFYISCMVIDIGGVASVTATVNGEYTVTLKEEEGLYQAQLPSSVLRDGTNTVVVTAEDASGNTVEKTQTFQIDLGEGGKDMEASQTTNWPFVAIIIVLVAFSVAVLYMIWSRSG